MEKDYLNVQKIISVNEKVNQKLIKKMKSIVAKLNHKYDFIKISKEEFNIWTRNALLSSWEKYSPNEEQVFLAFFEANLKQAIKEYIISEIEDKKNLTLVNDYIKSVIKIPNESDGSLNELQKLSFLFADLDCIPDVNFIDLLLENNETVYFLIQELIGHPSMVFKSKIDDLTDDLVLDTLIERYCTKNDIEVVDDLNLNISSEQIEEKFAQNGDLDIVKQYLNEIRYPILSKNEEIELLEKISQGDELARQFFIERNLRLVVSIVKHYSSSGLSFLDLIQEGNIALMHAIDNFDIKKGYKFSTYATSCIKHTLIKSITNKGYNIRIPVYMQEKIYKYNQTLELLTGQLGRKPTAEEVAVATGYTLSEIKKILYYDRDVISISTKVGEDDSETELEQYIFDEHSTPDELYEISALQEDVRLLLDKCNLTDKEMAVLVARYGLQDQNPKSLQEIAGELNLTGEGVRQIEAKAIFKIRISPTLKNLIDYMDRPDEAEIKTLFFQTKSLKGKNSKLSKANLEQEYADFREAFFSNPSAIQKKCKQINFKTNISIYKIFCSEGLYTEAEVDEVLPSLSPEDMELLYHRYGYDLKNPVINTKITNGEYHRISRILEKNIFGALKLKFGLPQSLKYSYTPNEGDFSDTSSSFRRSNLSSKTIKSVNYSRLKKLRKL